MGSPVLPGFPVVLVVLVHLATRVMTVHRAVVVLALLVFEATAVWAAKEGPPESQVRLVFAANNTQADWAKTSPQA